MAGRGKPLPLYTLRHHIYCVVLPDFCNELNVYAQSAGLTVNWDFAQAGTQNSPTYTAFLKSECSSEV